VYIALDSVGHSFVINNKCKKVSFIYNL